MTTESIITTVPMQSRVDPEIDSILKKASDSMMNEDYATSIRLLDKVIDFEPNNVNALINKGNVLDILGNYTDAVKCYNSAIECDPYNAEAWYNRGMTLKKTGDLEKGLQDIRKGISLSMGEI